MSDIQPRQWWVIADPGLPHQIILNFRRERDSAIQKIAVSCNCLKNTYSNEPIEARVVFPAREAVAVYRQWHADRGIELAS
jgi:hypothetical protein